MNRRLMCLLLGALVVCLTSMASADLVGRWKLDGDALDSSGNGLHGTLMDGAQFGAGLYGPALDLVDNQGYVNIDGYKGITIDPNDPNLVQPAFSVANWFKVAPGAANGNVEMVTWGTSAGRKRLTWRVHQGRLRTEHASGNLRGNTYVDDGEWHHGALTVTEGANLRPDVTKLYVDGVEDTTFSGSDNPYELTANVDVRIGMSGPQGGRYWSGLISDVHIFDHTLSTEEVQAVMNANAVLASNVSPAYGAEDVPYYSAISWAPGLGADAHDVYFGASMEDVADGAVAASVGQTETTYDPGLLDFGQTYYVRIDEVAADGSVTQGGIWPFTLEPVSLPIIDVNATASDANPDMGPEKTIDGSGLTDGQHGNEATDMWLAPGANPWIQYEFGKVEILNDMSIWNSNQPIESFLGFGMKEVVVETSVDGENWTAVEDANEFAQATSLPDYAANTVVDFGGVAAKYVRITGQSAFGMSGQMGLSEVSFSAIRAYPSELAPASDTQLNSLTTDLSWRAGRFAAEHQVVVNGVVVDTTMDKMSHISFNYGDVAVWQIVDVAADGTAYASDENVLFAPTEGVIAEIGEDLNYDLGGPDSTYMVKQFDPPLDLTVGNPDEVSVLYRGNNNPAPMKESGGSFAISAEGADIWDSSDEFRYVYKTLTGDGSITAQVTDLTLGVDDWSKAGVMIRQDNSAGSQHAFASLTSSEAGGGGASFQRRPVAGSASASNHPLPGSPFVAPYWFKLERTGNAFNVAISADGESWVPAGDPNVAIEMTDSVLIGMAVTSHSSGNYVIGEFSNVSTTGDVTGGWQVEASGKDMPGPNSGGRVFVTIGSKNGDARHIQAPIGSTLYPDWTPLVVGPWGLGSVDPTQITYMRVGVEGGKGAYGVINVGNVTASVVPGKQ